MGPSTKGRKGHNGGRDGSYMENMHKEHDVTGNFKSIGVAQGHASGNPGQKSQAMTPKPMGKSSKNPTIGKEDNKLA